MKKLHLLLLTLILLSGPVTVVTTVSAQAAAKPETPTIEVTGSAEILVTPNEFTFKITLRERIENKQKITIDQQEAGLKDGLAKIGIDVPKDLTVFDLRSNYVPIKKRSRDVLGAKDYRLKVYDLDKIDRLQELADNLNIDNLDLIETSHTELTRLRRETKMEAVKAAKTKADYMLGAIGESAGKALLIREIADEAESSAASNINRSIYSNTVGGFAGVPSSSPDPGTLTFTKIKLRYEVVARFEIQQK
jgi:uncharacterized protein YggE